MGPYGADHVSMVDILPPWKDNSLQETVKRMTPETLQGVMGEIQTGFYKVEKLDVLLPKFSISGDLELLEPLSSLGINSLFGGRSNLTGFMDQYGDSEDTIRPDSVPLGVQGRPSVPLSDLRQTGGHHPLLRSVSASSSPINYRIYCDA